MGKSVVKINSDTVLLGPFLLSSSVALSQSASSYDQVRDILQRQMDLVLKAGGSKPDIFSVSLFYAPEFDRKQGFEAFDELLADVQPIRTAVGIRDVGTSGELVRIEMKAAIGSSQGKTWKGIALKRQNFTCSDNTSCSSAVKLGPFVFVGGHPASDSHGWIQGVEDSQLQDNIIFQKEFDLLQKAGAEIADIVKIESYASRHYAEYKNKTEENLYRQYLKPVRPLHTLISVTDLGDSDALIQHEMFAVIGCGGREMRQDWGTLDFRRKNFSSGAPLEESIGYSRIVKTGPFVLCGGTTSVQPDGSIAFEKDSQGQRTYVLKKLLDLTEDLGVKAENVGYVRQYLTPDYARYLSAKDLQVKGESLENSVCTGLEIEKLNRPTQLIEFGMSALLD